MAPVSPHRDSRERAEQAFRLHSLGYTWQAIADHLGYKTRGGAALAAQRHMDRMPPMTTEGARKSATERLQIAAQTLAERVFEARSSGDDDRLVPLLRELRNTTAEMAKLNGLYVPVAQQVDVTVHQSATAIIDRMESDLLALAARQPNPQPALGAVIEGEVIEP